MSWECASYVVGSGGKARAYEVGLFGGFVFVEVSVVIEKNFAGFLYMAQRLFS
jgi:hypothetical protein